MESCEDNSLNIQWSVGEDIRWVSRWYSADIDQNETKSERRTHNCSSNKHKDKTTDRERQFKFISVITIILKTEAGVSTATSIKNNRSSSLRFYLASIV